jgi:hypothetical protein
VLLRYLDGRQEIQFYTRTQVVTSRCLNPGTSTVDVEFPQVRE